MHDILEGVAHQIIKMILQVYIKNKKYFTCATWNSRIQNFNYGPTEIRDKPSANLSLLKLSEKGNRLKQTAAQTWLLLRVFPFIIYNLIPENDLHFNMITMLQKITYVAFSDVTTNEMIENMDQNVKALHQKFKELFPEKVPINKLHHLSHYAYNARMTSVPNDYSCMRFEALNKLPKSQMRNGQNFRNVPYSLAKRLNLKQVTAIVNRTFSQRVEILSETIIPKHEIEDRDLIQHFPCNVNSIKHLVIDGIHFQQGVIIKHDDDENIAQYAMILMIIYVDKFYFIAERMITICFVEQFNSYKLQSSQEHILIPEERVYKRKTYSLWSPFSSDNSYISQQYYDDFK